MRREWEIQLMKLEWEMRKRKVWKYEENEFKKKLADALEKVKRSYRFGRFGYEIINKVSTTWEIQGRRPDITVFVLNQPFLIIECKIKPDPSSEYAINQAYTYALLARNEGYSVDFVATTDPYYMMIFRVPKNLEDYANWEAIERRKYNEAFHPLFYLLVDKLRVVRFSYDLDSPEAPKVLHGVMKKLIEGCFENIDWEKTRELESLARDLGDWIPFGCFGGLNSANDYLYSKCGIPKSYSWAELWSRLISHFGSVQIATLFCIREFYRRGNPVKRLEEFKQSRINEFRKLAELYQKYREIALSEAFEMMIERMIGSRLRENNVSLSKRIERLLEVATRK